MTDEARKQTASEHWEDTVSVARRRRAKRQFDEPLVNLTSMVDVLSVLLFFLLSIYSGGGYLTILPAGLKLPNSNVRASLSRRVEIAVLPDRILVDRQAVPEDLAQGTDGPDLLLPGLQA